MTLDQVPEARGAPLEVRALTGVRGAGALLVVIYHYGMIRLDHVHDVWSVPHGYLAVDLFFILSGYVIAQGYKDAFLSHPLRSHAVFLVRRLARLYPAYAVIGLLFFLRLAFHLHGDETLERLHFRDYVGNVLMMTGWGLSIYPLNGVAWAASSQLGAYILFPLLLKPVMRWGVLSWAVSVLAAAVGVYIVARSGTGYNGPLDVVDVRSPLPMVRAVTGFTFGLAVARYAGRLDRLGRPILDALLVGALAAIVAAAVLTRSDFPLYALLIGLVALLSRGTPLAERLFGNKVLWALGTVSYSFYLVHQLFLQPAALLARYFGASEGAYAASVLFFLGVIWGLSALIWRYVEEPGRRWVGGLGRSGAAKVAAPAIS